MKKLLVRFGHDDAGVTAIEYGLIAALVAVALIATVTNMRVALGNTFTTIKTALAG